MQKLQQPKKVLKLTPEEAAKVARTRKRHEKRSIDPEDLFIAEFGYYFGWEGIQAIRIDRTLSLADAKALLDGARKVWYQKIIDTAVATYTANAASQSKKPKSVLNKGLAGFIKEAKL